MACMCGDYCCSSCGPAQGNWTCPVCGEWASEGCDHLTEDGTGVKPEFQAEVEAAAAAEAAYWKAYVDDMQWEEEHRDEIAAVIKEL